jgi:hypothetical protein
MMALIINVTERKEYEITLRNKEKREKELSYAKTKIIFKEELLKKEKN